MKPSRRFLTLITKIHCEVNAILCSRHKVSHLLRVDVTLTREGGRRAFPGRIFKLNCLFTDKPFFKTYIFARSFRE